MNFVCMECRRGNHDRCRGGTWCDCLHRPSGHVHDQFMVGCLSCWVALQVEVTSQRRVPQLTPVSRGWIQYYGGS